MDVVVEAVTDDRTERHRIIDDGHGMVGFLCPPGHVNHRYRYEVDERPSGRGRWPVEPYMMGSIESATGGDVPEPVRSEARRLIAVQPLMLSEAWLGYVYGYFKGCYFPSGVLNVNSEIITRSGAPEQHGGCLKVRKYFPDHEPRVDLIESGGSYGSWECRGCHRRVQYEPRIDGFSVYGERTAVCIGDEPHEPEA